MRPISNSQESSGYIPLHAQLVETYMPRHSTRKAIRDIERLMVVLDLLQPIHHDLPNYYCLWTVAANAQRYAVLPDRFAAETIGCGKGKITRLKHVLLNLGILTMPPQYPPRKGTETVYRLQVVGDFVGVRLLQEGETLADITAALKLAAAAPIETPDPNDPYAVIPYECYLQHKLAAPVTAPPKRLPRRKPAEWFRGALSGEELDMFVEAEAIEYDSGNELSAPPQTPSRLRSTQRIGADCGQEWGGAPNPITRQELETIIDIRRPRWSRTKKRLYKFNYNSLKSILYKKRQEEVNITNIDNDIYANPSSFNSNATAAECPLVLSSGVDSEHVLQPAALLPINTRARTEGTGGAATTPDARQSRPVCAGRVDKLLASRSTPETAMERLERLFARCNPATLTAEQSALLLVFMWNRLARMYPRIRSIRITAKMEDGTCLSELWRYLLQRVSSEWNPWFSEWACTIARIHNNPFLRGDTGEFVATFGWALTNFGKLVDGDVNPYGDTALGTKWYIKSDIKPWEPIEEYDRAPLMLAEYDPFYADMIQNFNTSMDDPNWQTAQPLPDHFGI